MSWAFLAHFALFTGYNMMRPLREMVGLRHGSRDLPYLFAGTFCVMLLAVPLYAALVVRFPRRVFLPKIYRFFSLNLILFTLAFLWLSESGVRWTGYAYFVWLSVFNLFAVSVFWSFMADIFTNAESKRLFGLLAAGASLGSIAGGLLMKLVLLLVPEDSIELLLLMPIVFLELFVLCIRRIGRWLDEESRRTDDPERAAAISRADREVLRQGGLWSGLTEVARSPYLAGICLYMLLATSIGSQVYFYQGSIVVAAGLDEIEKTKLFNDINLTVNSLSLFVQALVVGRLWQRVGVSWTLIALPLFYIVGFAWFGSNPVLAALVTFEVSRRVANYAIAKPSKEVLFTVVTRDQKYKSKSFIDTAVYRGGDALGGAIFALLHDRGGLSLTATAWITVPFCAAWAGIAWMLGRQQKAMAEANDVPDVKVA